MKYLKRAELDSEAERVDFSDQVDRMLAEIEKRGEEAVRDYAKKLDGWTDDFVLSDQKRDALIARVPEAVKDDIRFAHEQIVRFADAQRASLQPFEIEPVPGVRLGQRIITVGCAGCYIPGGRYAHTASALMSVATAKAAGVGQIVACSPPRGNSINAATAFALDLAGADTIMELGGVQAIASMAFGLFGNRPADIIAGPGNAYVAEAKRLLFGRVGIDVFAGPTETAIIADETADPMTIAIDLVSQAEHGPDSPVWLFSTSEAIAKAVLDLLPKVAADMPNAAVVLAAWKHHGEVMLCESREEAVTVSDRYAPEHLQILAADHDWWLQNLTAYGSLFLGEGSTVTHGDKCVGTNHILPTRRAGRYTGGLNVLKFMKILTYQELDKEANRTFSAVASRISRYEGMEGHARACDWRLRKYFPDEHWAFDVHDQRRLQ